MSEVKSSDSITTGKANSNVINLDDCPEFPPPIGSTTPPKKPRKTAKSKTASIDNPSGDVTTSKKANTPINFDERIYDFPHTKDNGQKNSSTANLRNLLNGYGIKVSYDEMLKEQKMVFGNEFDNAHGDLLASANLAELNSLVDINGLNARILNLLPSIFSSNAVNPILDFIKSKEWDGWDRIIDLANTLTVSDNDYDYSYLALKTWLIQCVAAADSARHTGNKNAIAKYELVLILQGGQGARKTSWFQRLLPSDLKKYILDGVHLDPSNKDSVKQAISCWICELGELDSTFRRSDIAQLKAFLSKQDDTLRLPYDRAASSLRRRVSFCGSVNPEMFLVDSQRVTDVFYLCK